jgi:hypothetical protein
MYISLVKQGFEFSAKLRAPQRLGQEIMLERFVFQLIADHLKSLLIVYQSLDDGT